MIVLGQAAPVVQQFADMDIGIRETGKVFFNRVIQRYFSLFHQLQHHHGGEGLGNRSYVEYRIGSNRFFGLEVDHAAIILEHYFAVLGKQYAAIEPPAYQQGFIQGLYRICIVLFYCG